MLLSIFAGLCEFFLVLSGSWTFSLPHKKPCTLESHSPSPSPGQSLIWLSLWSCLFRTSRSKGTVPCVAFCVWFLSVFQVLCSCLWKGKLWPRQTQWPSRLTWQPRVRPLYSALLRASAWGLCCGELQVMENLTPHLLGSIIQRWLFFAAMPEGECGVSIAWC